MPAIEFSRHAEDMLRERNIPKEWAYRAVQSPDQHEVGADGNTHYLKAIPERANRVLRVVVNRQVSPLRVVTVFFDRRLRRQHEAQDR